MANDKYRTDTSTLIDAMYILARDTASDTESDTIQEAAERLSELNTCRHLINKVLLGLINDDIAS